MGCPGRTTLLLEHGTDAGPQPRPAPAGLRKRLSPLRYPGGKSKMIDLLWTLLRLDHLETFVEPFAGGASVGLALLDAGKIGRLILDDADPAVYAFWDTVLTAPEELLRRLDSALPTIEDYWQAKEVLRYPGGKSKMIDLLWTLLRPDHLETFVEPFAGGASVGLALLDAGKVGRLILDDADPAVYGFWDTVLTAPEELLRRLDGAPPTIEDHWQAKEVLRRPVPQTRADQIELAWAFLVLDRTCFSGIVMAGPMGGKEGGSFLSRWIPAALKARIARIAELSPKIELHGGDACHLLEDTCPFGPSCTIFVDPPYYEKGPKLYPLAFDREDHIRLARTLEMVRARDPEVDILLSYDDHSEIRALYPSVRQISVGRKWSVANRPASV